MTWLGLFLVMGFLCCNHGLACNYVPRTWSRAHEVAKDHWGKKHPGQPFTVSEADFDRETGKKSIYEQTLKPYIRRKGQNPYAVATITNSGYCGRSWALYKSFKRLNVPETDFLVMFVGSFNGLLRNSNDAKFCRALKKFGAKFVPITKIPLPATSKMPPHYRVSLNRLRAFGFTQYKRILYSDSDAIFLSADGGFAPNDDFVQVYFEAHEPGVLLSAMDQCAMNCRSSRRHIVNGGLLSFTPSEYLLNITIARLQKPGCLTPHWHYSDQELVICLTIRDRLVRGRIWDPPFSVMMNTYNKCRNEFPTCSMRHVHYACARKPPCNNCDRQPLYAVFSRLWNHGCTSSVDC